MSEIRVSILYMLALSLTIILSATKAESFDAKAISRVSQGIAEQKLMSKDKSEAGIEPTVYVSSALSEMVKKGSVKGVGIVNGLAALDNYYSIEPIELQIEQWEINTTADILNSIDLHDVLIGSGNIDPYWGKVITSDYQVFHDSLAPASSIYSNISTIGSVAITTMEITDKVLTINQISNPPIYLSEKTPWGWKGQGYYSISGVEVNYRETLNTTGTDIVRKHDDWFETPSGLLYERHFETTTPASGIERVLMDYKPVGAYFDASKSTIYTRTITYQSYTEIKNPLGNGINYRIPITRPKYNPQSISPSGINFRR